MKIAIIGLGNICKKAYMPYITSKENIELVLCTRNPQVLEETKKKYRINEGYTKVEDLMDKNIKAAFVHTATESHFEIIKKLLENNINVYVDKPLSYSYKESEILSNLAKEKKLILMTGFNRRFAPMYSTLANKEKPSILKAEKNRLFSPKDPKIVILDDFIHVLDTAKFLLKEKVKAIDVNYLKKEGLLYNILVTLKGENSTAIAIMNRDSGFNEEVVEYTFPGNKYIIKNLNNTHYYSNNEEQILTFNDWDTILYRRGFEPIIDEFINCVRNNIEPSITIEDALETHRLCEEILRQVAGDR